MSNLKKFLIASMRLIVINDIIQALQLSKSILELEKASMEVITLNNIISSYIQKKKILRRFILTRFEWILVGEFDFDIDNFSFLTRKDIKRGYIPLNDDETYFLLLHSGKVVPYEYIHSAEEIPSPVKEFNLVWPI